MMVYRTLVWWQLWLYIHAYILYISADCLPGKHFQNDSADSLLFRFQFFVHFNGQTGEARDRTTHLLIGRQPALPPELQPPQTVLKKQFISDWVKVGKSEWNVCKKFELPQMSVVCRTAESGITERKHYRRWEKFCLVKQKSVKITGITCARASRRHADGLFPTTQIWRTTKAQFEKHDSKYHWYLTNHFFGFSSWILSCREVW